MRRGVRLVTPKKCFPMFWDKQEYQESWRRALFEIITKLQEPKCKN